MVAEHGPRLAAVLLVLGVLSLGVAGWAYANPPTTTVTDRENPQTVRTSVHTSAVVDGNGSFHAAGTELRDKPVYLLSTTPRLGLDLETDVPAGDPVRLTYRVSTVYNVSYDGKPFWNDSRVAFERTTTTRSGSATARATLDVRRIRQRIERLEDELGSDGRVHAAVRIHVAYETPRYEGAVSKTEPIRVTDRSYSFDPPTLSETRGESVTRTVPLPNRDPLGYLVPGTLGIAALAAAVGTLLWYARTPDSARLADDLQRARYDEWVSEGSLSIPLTSDAVAMRSLEDLVDVAIDAGRRVVYDPDRGVYAVVDGDTVYRYDEGTLPKTHMSDL